MMHCKIHYIETNMYLRLLFFLSSISLLSSCANELDRKIEVCYNAKDTLVFFSDIYPEEWDTLYYFTAACQMEDMEGRVGPIIRKLWGDVGDRILILDKKKNVVCYKEFFPNYGQDIEGTIFDSEKWPKIVALPRNDTKFLVQKDGKAYIMLYKGKYDIFTNE